MSLDNRKPKEEKMAEGGTIEAPHMSRFQQMIAAMNPSLSHDKNEADQADKVDQSSPTASGYADGGVSEPDENQFTAQLGQGMTDGINHDSDAVKTYLMNKFSSLVHPDDKKAVPVGQAEPTDKPQGMAEGGFADLKRDKEPPKPKDIDMSNEKKMAAVYKAMGIKKYADGGDVVGDIDPSQLPTPESSDPSFWDKIKDALAKVSGPVTGAVGDTLGKALPVTMPQVAEGAAGAAAAPGIAPAINSALGTSLPDSAAPIAPPAAPPAVAPPVMPPAMPAQAVAPIPMGQTSATPDIKGIFNQDTSKLTAGFNPEDRQALAGSLQSSQHGIGSIIGQALAGLGDALAAKGGREQHALGNIFSLQKTQRDEALANFDKARQDRLQKVALQSQLGDNALKQAAAQDAYGADEHLNALVGAPKGTMKKDLPSYLQLTTAKIGAQEKDADLYMKAHAQAATDLDNAVKNSSMLGIKPSASQLEASGAKLADNYYNRAKGNVLVKPSDGGQAVWIPAQNLHKAKQMDPNLQVQQ